MLHIAVILSLMASITAQTWLSRNSAASDAQIRFAIENKYDTTGPGAQTPEYAYKTYQTLDEALVAYVNDPDTQLPELEKNRALHKLTRPTYNSISEEPITRYQPKTVDEYTGYKPQIQNLHTSVPEYESYKPQVLQLNSVVTDFSGWKPSYVNSRKPVVDHPYYQPKPVINNAAHPKNYNKYVFETLNNEERPVIENSLSLSHLAQSEQEDFNPHPQYSFSYGVHDKGTGDSKSAHESRNGGTVHGYYTFMDADGKQRTVHYTADDKRGFRASVQRTHTNSQ